MEHRDALDVVGHREEVEGAQRVQPVAVGSERREITGEAGRVAGDVRRRPAGHGRRSGVRRPCPRPPAAGRARRPRVAPAPVGSARSGPPGSSDGPDLRLVGQVLTRRCVDGPAMRLDRDHRARPVPTPSASTTAEEPDAGVQVPRSARPASGSAPSRTAVGQGVGGPRVHLPEVACAGPPSAAPTATSVTVGLGPGCGTTTRSPVLDSTDDGRTRRPGWRAPVRRRTAGRRCAIRQRSTGTTSERAVAPADPGLPVRRG